MTYLRSPRIVFCHLSVSMRTCREGARDGPEMILAMEYCELVMAPGGHEAKS